MRTIHATIVSAAVLVSMSACAGPERRISLATYEDKVYASWLGQCIGNMYGLAHEFKYNDQPRTEPIDGWAESSLDRIRKAGGAFSDDDTDIEYVDLFCMEKYGPEPTYEQLAEFWKLCINRKIWVANRSARDLMDKGYLPPLTGRRGLNPNWFQIDPQLVCEIWAVTAPGMLDYAAAKADWAARVTNDDYGTHPTIWYNTMYAAGFFETDVEQLCRIGCEHLPAGSIFREAIDDVRQWKAEHGDDWVAVRKRIKEKYHDREGLPEEVATSRVGALLNGALGVLALLYGQGDFEKTMNYACMAGYDADNQCATLAGLVGIMHGSGAIPRKYTHILDGWEAPLNDFYKNLTRDHLPDARITDMARRTAALGRQLVLEHGGRIEHGAEGDVLVINPQARYIAPLEVRLFPIHLDAGSDAVLQVEVIGGVPEARRRVTIAGSLPAGMESEWRGPELVIAGTPKRVGRYEITATVASGAASRTTALPVFVHRPNLARSAARILAAITKPTGGGSRDLEVLRDASTREVYDSYDGENTLEEDFYGYEWPGPVSIGRLVFVDGPVCKDGGWFETLGVQYRDQQNQWTPVANLEVIPPLTPATAGKGGTMFVLAFEPVTTTAIRIIGKPGGSAQFTNVKELSVYEK